MAKQTVYSDAVTLIIVLIAYVRVQRWLHASSWVRIYNIPYTIDGISCRKHGTVCCRPLDAVMGWGEWVSGVGVCGVGWSGWSAEAVV